MADPRINTAELVEHGICRAIRRILGLRVTEVNLTHRLVEDLHCESIDLIEIPMAIEDRFGIKTVADYCVLTRAKLALLHPAPPQMLVLNIAEPLASDYRQRLEAALKGYSPPIFPDITGAGIIDLGSGDSQS